MTVEQIEPLVDKYMGNVAAIARALGVSREVIHRRINESPRLRQAVQNARDTMDDNAESVFYKKVLDGSTPELLHYVKTRLRSRGYGENVQVASAVVEMTVDEWKKGAQARLAQAESALALLSDEDGHE